MCLCSVFVLDHVVVVVVVVVHHCNMCIKVTCVSICKSRVLLVLSVGFVKEAEYLISIDALIAI